MNYRGNMGCLWALLAIALLGGTPFLIGLARIFFGFILLVFVGGAIGSWWIRRNAVRIYTSTQSERHNEFVQHLVKLLVRLSEIDGEMTRNEVTTIRLFFQQDLGYSDEKLLWVRDLIKEARRGTERVEDLCASMRSNFSMQERFIVLQVLSRVAQADGKITPAEAAFVEEVANLLGLDPFVRSFHMGGGGAGGMADRAAARIDDAFADLGLARDAQPEEIKRTWRELSKENHPDRVSHLGEEFRQLAEQRMRKINAAYDVLKEAGLAV